jgi:hypothetical protein
LSKPPPAGWQEPDKIEILSMVLWLACRMEGKDGKLCEAKTKAGGHDIKCEIRSGEPAYEFRLVLLSPHKHHPIGIELTPPERDKIDAFALRRRDHRAAACVLEDFERQSVNFEN